MADDQTHLNKTEARAGSAPGVVRYILGVSLVAVIILFAVIVYAWS